MAAVHSPTLRRRKRLDNVIQRSTECLKAERIIDDTTCSPSQARNFLFDRGIVYFQKVSVAEGESARSFTCTVHFEGEVGRRLYKKKCNGILR